MTEFSCYITTPLGTAEIIGSEAGVSTIHVHDQEMAPSTEIASCLQQAVTELSEYFQKKRTGFTFPINPTGTEFQKRVWQELSKIPFGTTISYADLTQKLGDMKAIRAVASANGRNPLWIVVPCHRVIGSDGSLTGYAGGLWRKKWLMEHEGALRQTSLF